MAEAKVEVEKKPELIPLAEGVGVAVKSTIKPETLFSKLKDLDVDYIFKNKNTLNLPGFKNLGTKRVKTFSIANIENINHRIVVHKDQNGEWELTVANGDGIGCSISYTEKKGIIRRSGNWRDAVKACEEAMK